MFDITRDKIEFNGRLYDLRLIDFGEEWGRYFVSSIQLEDLLIDEESRYTSVEAREVDEAIFYYVPVHYFKLSDYNLRDTILDEFG